jgi:hypothetical protein
MEVEAVDKDQDQDQDQDYLSLSLSPNSPLQKDERKEDQGGRDAAGRRGGGDVGLGLCQTTIPKAKQGLVPSF